MDSWRAHLSPTTWPEVLRQLALTHGAGRPRPRGVLGGGGGDKPKLGTEGEDVVEGDGEQLRLQMPARFGDGTVKAAAWKVRARVMVHVMCVCGLEGTNVSELVSLLQRPRALTLTPP